MDFSELRRVTPAGLVALAATVFRWQRENRSVRFEGLKACSILGYLQRMDLFKTLGIELREKFSRHEAKGRFVPIRLIDHEVDKMGTELAGCLAPGGEDYEHPMAHLYSLSWYILTEIANNARQHSGGKGFVSAQVNRTEGFVRLAIADNGRGILKSFDGFDWSKNMTDAEAIKKALLPTVSCKGSPTNEGVGLTLVAELVKQTKGWFLIVSGGGTVQIAPYKSFEVKDLPNAARYQGTLVVLTFAQQNVGDYAEQLHAAKIKAGLLQRPGEDIRFIS